ncbi:FimV/HubP family polar landmark protein [Accumulibacter sp.]|uniref:FimV/HubP family polar landmark protein n=1 Tax=Accumulibacter sp. TaxID=2053492 RepID=UPI0035B3E6B3
MAKKLNHTAPKLRLRTSVCAVASSLALAAFPLPGHAAGLGKLTVFSGLGQPLRAELEVFASREELAGLKAQVASPEAFKQAGVEYTAILSGLALSVDKRPNGQAVIRLTSARPINEPFVDVLVELNWPTGRLLREYTFLLDPPEFAARSAPAPSVARPIVAATPPAESRPAEERAPRPPRQRASEQRPPAGDGGATYEVKRGETLSQIARELKPEGVSLDQMLLGLFRANPDAFDQGNINRLRAGKVLSVPDRAALETIPNAEAKTVIVAQSADWGAYRKKLGAAAADAPAREEGPRQQAAGRVSTRVEDKAAGPVEPRDQLKVSRTEPADAKLQPAPKRGDEDLIAKEKALRDANERLASLERNVAELQRLLEMKSQTLADLERQSAGKAAATPPTTQPPAATVGGAAAPSPAAPVVAAAPAAAPTPTPVAAAPAAAPASQPAESGVPAPPPRAEAPPPAPVAEAAKPAEPPPVKPAPPPPPPVVEEPGFFADLLGSPATLAGGGGIVALLAAYWFFKRRREGSGETTLATPSTLTPFSESVADKSIFRNTGGQNVDTSHSIGQTDFSQAGPGSIDTDEVDPVAEADVYMAYGRDAQAEEILLEAKQKDPGRHAIHLKLLEIYLTRADAKPFLTQAQELFAATGGAGPEWEKAAGMGRQLMPDNPLFGQPGTGEETASMPPQPAPATAGGAGAAAAPESLEDTLTRPGQLAGMVAAVGAAATTTAAATASREEQPATQAMGAGLEELDFDLGASGTALAGQRDVGEAALETTLAFANPQHEQTLDFDLETSLPKDAFPADEEHQTARLIDDASSLEVTMLVAPEARAGDRTDDNRPEFEFDLSEPAADETAWNVATEPQAGLGEGLADAADSAEALEFDVRLTESTVLGEAMQAQAFDMSSISLDLGQPETLTAGATPSMIGALDFSFEADQADTVVNPDFASDQTDTEVNPAFGEATALADQIEISSSEEVATKLDLARAYQDMGDAEGARELLQEVVNEGDATQRQAALALLSALRE